MTCLSRTSSSIIVSLMLLASLCVFAVDNLADWRDGSPLVTTDKTVYLKGETVRINVTCYIPSWFSSSGQCFYTVADESGKVVYDFRNHTYVFWVLTGLAPPKTFSFDWSQVDDQGRNVPPGNYVVWGYEAGYDFWGPPIAGNWTHISILNESVPVPVLNKMDVRLLKGWNLFSLPLIASNYTSSSLGLPSRSLVYRWDSASQSYDRVFVVGVSPLSMDFPLEEGTGYWIYPTSNCTVTVYGSVVNSTRHYSWNVPLSGGWVLVGFPKASQTWPARDVSSWTDNPDAVRAVAMWNPGFQMYNIYIPGVDVPPIFFMIAGSGCWVSISESVAVAYGP